MNRQTTPIRTAIYARVGAGKQGGGCTAQIQQLKEYVENDARRSLNGVYADDGVSANAHRPQWEQLLADCDAGKYDEILAVSLSRLERNSSKFSQLVGRLANANVRIATMQEDHTRLSLISGSVMNDG